MLIKVRAFPDSKEERIIKKNENSFDVFVEEVAERNMANKRIIEIIAEYFNVPQHKAKMIKGFKESSKIFDIKD
jgi:uncharacterized protein